MGRLSIDRWCCEHLFGVATPLQESPLQKTCCNIDRALGMSISCCGNVHHSTPSQHCTCMTQEAPLLQTHSEAAVSDDMERNGVTRAGVLPTAVAVGPAKQHHQTHRQPGSDTFGHTLTARLQLTGHISVRILRILRILRQEWLLRPARCAVPAYREGCFGARGWHSSCLLNICFLRTN